MEIDSKTLKWKDDLACPMIRKLSSVYVLAHSGFAMSCCPMADSQLILMCYGVIFTSSTFVIYFDYLHQPHSKNSQNSLVWPRLLTSHALCATVMNFSRSAPDRATILKCFFVVSTHAWVHDHSQKVARARNWWMEVSLKLLKYFSRLHLDSL